MTKANRGSVKTPSPKPRKRAKKQSVDPVGPKEQTHRQRFDQLLDDVVFGKPTKR